MEDERACLQPADAAVEGDQLRGGKIAQHNLEGLAFVF